MAGLTWIWILTGLCVGFHLSTASPVLRPAHVVQVGQNISLACNLTSSAQITWYRLQRGDRLQPLVTVTAAKFGKDTEDLHQVEKGRFISGGRVENGTNSLEILKVEEDDAGLYFCSGRTNGVVTVSAGIHLSFHDLEGASARGGAHQPCWTLGVCLLPPLLLFCCLFVVGLFLCSGKCGVSCCKTKRGDAGLRAAEDVCLHYSSLKHPHKPRPPRQAETRLVEEDVTYSAVNNRKNLMASNDK